MELHDLLTRCGQELRDRASYQVSVRNFLFSREIYRSIYHVVGCIKFLAQFEIVE